MEEIKTNLTAFDKKAYTKKEVLNQLLALQTQMGRELPELLSAKPKARAHDIVSYLKKWNGERGNIADAELAEFAEQSKAYTERIRAEVSGIEGERKAYRSLQTIKKPCKLLHNVELKCEGHVTEIDIVAVTNSAVFLVEVKNSTRDIIIDEKGNYSRIAKSGYQVRDKNIGVQMNEKEFVVRSILKSAGYEDINIQSLVVFTNSNINVENRYPYIKECYLSDLPHIIEEYEAKIQYRAQMLTKLVEVILAARSDDSWPIKFDVDAYKTAFATVLAKLQMPEQEEQAVVVSFHEKLAACFGSFFRKVAKAACFMFS
jgi:hypothetical protein